MLTLELIHSHCSSLEGIWMEWFSVKRLKRCLVKIVRICYKHFELLPVSRSWSPSRHHSLLEYLSLIGHKVVFLVLLLGDVSVVFLRATAETVEAFFGLQLGHRLREVVGVV